MGEIIPEQTYAKDQVHRTSTLLVDQSADGWSVKLSSEKWPDKTPMGTLSVYADFGSGTHLLFRGTLDGGGVRYGEPITSAGVSGTWGGEADGKGRIPVKPISIYAELEPLEPLITSIELATDLKASSVIDIGGVSIPKP